MNKKGIDVSKWQGKINWEEMKNEIDFAIIRVGWGQNNIDSQAKRNCSECNRLGIPIGVYWFSYAYTSAMSKKEAEYCHKFIKNYKIDLPVAFDFEGDSRNYALSKGVNVNKTLASSIFLSFADTIKSYGYDVMNYTNLDYIKNYFNEDTLKHPLWIADWTGEMSYKGNGTVSFWQTTSHKIINNIRYDYNEWLEGTEQVILKDKYIEISLPILKKGSFGHHVFILQLILQYHGLYKGIIDSDFTDEVELSVKNYQTMNLLKVDGFVGKQTWSELL